MSGESEQPVPSGRRVGLEELKKVLDPETEFGKKVEGGRFDLDTLRKLDQQDPALAEQVIIGAVKIAQRRQVPDLPTQINIKTKKRNTDEFKELAPKLGDTKRVNLQTLQKDPKVIDLWREDE